MPKRRTCAAEEGGRGQKTKRRRRGVKRVEPRGIEALPEELLGHCLSFAVDTLTEAELLRAVSPAFRKKVPGSMRRLKLSDPWPSDLLTLKRYPLLTSVAVVHATPEILRDLAETEGMERLLDLSMDMAEPVTTAAVEAIACKLPMLRSLKLAYSGITDAGVRALARLKHLRELRIVADAAITEAGLLSLRLILPGLQVLEITGNITDAFLGALGPGLRELSLWNCPRVTAAGLEAVARLGNLEDLALRRCGPVDATCLRRLTRLRRLRLQGVRGCRHVLPSLHRPEALVLEDSDVGDADLRLVRGFGELRHLGLRGSRGVTDAGLRCTLGALRHLRRLDLGSCYKLTDEGLHGLDQLGDLEHLDLSLCSRVTDAGLRGLGGLRKLKNLDLSCCPAVTDKTLEQAPPGILHLNLHNCVALTDEGLGLIPRLAGLRHLDLGGCTEITDAGMGPLAEMAALAHLDLGQCAKITATGIRTVSANPAFCMTVIDQGGTLLFF
jgi:F-box/leucine-rich repeat protein 14